MNRPTVASVLRNTEIGEVMNYSILSSKLEDTLNQLFNHETLHCHYRLNDLFILMVKRIKSTSYYTKECYEILCRLRRDEDSDFSVVWLAHTFAKSIRDDKMINLVEEIRENSL